MFTPPAGRATLCGRGAAGCAAGDARGRRGAPAASVLPALIVSDAATARVASTYVATVAVGAVLIFVGGHTRVMKLDETPELPRWVVGVLSLGAVLAVGLYTGFDPVPGAALFVGVVFGMLLEKNVAGRQDDGQSGGSPAKNSGE